MKKMILIMMVSLSMIACNESGSGDASDGSTGGSNAVYGIDYEYDNTHPDGITVEPDGVLKPFPVNTMDVVNECGRYFYKDYMTGDVFYAEHKMPENQWYAKQIGYYAEYDENLGGFQVVGYQARQIVSVGSGVVMSNYTGLSQYFNWTRVNYINEFSHNNCMVIIDEANRDVLSVDLTTETTTSIF